MTELQKEYCEQKGLMYIKPENTQIYDYVTWLEAQIQSLRINDVSGMCVHPWASVIGDGEMKPAKCLRCGKYL